MPDNTPKLKTDSQNLDRRWHVRLADGTEKGPYHESHIQDLRQFGNLPEDFEVKSVNEPDWHPVNTHPESPLFVPKDRIKKPLQTRAPFKAKEVESGVELTQLLEKNVEVEKAATRKEIDSKHKAIMAAKATYTYIINTIVFAIIGTVASFFLVEVTSLATYVAGAIFGAIVGALFARLKTDLTAGD